MSEPEVKLQPDGIGSELLLDVNNSINQTQFILSFGEASQKDFMDRVLKNQLTILKVMQQLSED